LRELLRTHLGGGRELDEALAQGAAMSSAEVIAWLRRARGARKRPAGGWESLTPTEQKVVEFAADGLTNPEIGERMFISRGTVKVHLSHIYAKLNVRNRSELMSPGCFSWAAGVAHVQGRRAQRSDSSRCSAVWSSAAP